MQYFLLMEGNGEGCDYTIGCNKVYQELKAANREDAKKEVKGIVEDYGGLNREGGWKEIKILEVCRVINKIIPNKDFDDE